MLPPLIVAKTKTLKGAFSILALSYSVLQCYARTTHNHHPDVSEDVDTMFSMMDTNKNGVVSPREFWTTDHSSVPDPEALWTLTDTDGNGLITKQELAASMEKANNAEVGRE